MDPTISNTILRKINAIGVGRVAQAFAIRFTK